MKSSTQFDHISIEKSAAQFHEQRHTATLTPGDIRRFRNIIYRYYRNNARDTLPWRNTDNPYHILVSEIMLQQTQIERVLNKYPLFISKFPDFRSLSSARVRSVYAVWQGMGYNRRMLALKEIARTIVKPPYNGRLPSDVNELMALPFVGQSTAGAVAAFAFHKPAVFIETNIRRVLIHFFFREQERVTDRNIIPLIEKTIDRKDPRNWYYALMDYGSALKKLTENPNLKSAHYRKQNVFEGSDRQLRGKILQLLMKRSPIPLHAIVKQLNTEYAKIRSVTDKLCREGFITKKGRNFMMTK
jgi:A/G-specific adenine glycosylase